MDDQRRDQHRQHHRRQHELLDVRRHDAHPHARAPAAPARTHRPARDKSRCATTSTSGAPNARDSATISASLSDHRHQQQQQHPAPVRGDHRQIERHADGDEEQAEQDVAKRLDVVLDLIAVFGLRDQHARQERAERQRQSGERGQLGQPERDQQHVQHEQFWRARPRDDVEPRAHRPLADEEDQRQRDQRLEACRGERPREVGPRLSERRQHDQEGDHSEVLEQQDAHDVAAVRRRELHPLGQHLRHDRGRAHGQRAAERESGLPAEAQQPAARSSRRSW